MTAWPPERVAGAQLTMTSVSEARPEGWAPVGFFRLAAANQVVVRALLRDDETLEELFLRTVSNPA